MKVIITDSSKVKTPTNAFELGHLNPTVHADVFMS